MVVFEMVAIIVTVSVIGGVINNWLKVKAKEKSDNSAELDAETTGRINKLEERVRVLERIVTDKSHRLKDEIDAL